MSHSAPLVSSLIVVPAKWDEDAKVWVAESSDVPGLVTEADSLDALESKLPGLIRDLIDDSLPHHDLSLEVVASKRVRLTANAVLKQAGLPKHF
jgi:predicted RNase H-like HicB family nuclease